MRRVGIIILSLFIGTACASGTAFAVSAQDIARAQGSLEYTLNTLKESVARLSMENKELAALNEKLRLKLRTANAPLVTEQARASRIAVQFQELEPRYQKKLAEQSLRDAQLKEAVEAVDVLRSEHAGLENALKPKEAEDVEVTARINALSRELGDIRSGLVSGQDRTAELQALRTEQAALQKDLDASSEELQRASDEWKELSVAINAGPGQVEIFSKEQEGLKADSARLTQEIEALRQRLAAAVKQAEEAAAVVSAETAAQMEQDIQDLDDQAQTLDKEVADIEKQLRGSKLSPSAEAKLKKDEARLKELLEHNRDLKMGLKNLQRTMVSLDRKKSDLEKAMDSGRSY